MGKSKQLHKGTMKINLAYQRQRRIDATAGAVADAMSGHGAPECPACRGQHRAHTCGRGLAAPRAAPHVGAATEARLGSPADEQMHIIEAGYSSTRTRAARLRSRARARATRAARSRCGARRAPRDRKPPLARASASTRARARLPS